MTSSNFYEVLRKKADTLWQAIFSHPFVTGIGDGTLSHEQYEFFLKQDYVYLINFSRFLALGSAKAQNVDDMSYFAKLLDVTLNMEMELHRKTCQEFGIPLEQLEQTEPAMITSAYTNLLVRTGYEGDFSDIVAVLLPCAIGYKEIGDRLKSQKMPEDNFYQDWINTYSSDEYGEVCERLKIKMNHLADDATDSDKDRWFRLYRAGARFEYLFFDMSWKKQMWDENIPN